MVLIDVVGGEEILTAAGGVELDVERTLQVRSNRRDGLCRLLLGGSIYERRDSIDSSRQSHKQLL